MSARAARAGGTLADGLIVPQEAELVWVEGTDAASFLNGLFTNDAEALRQGHSQLSLLLDPKGRVRTFVRVRRDEPDAYTLVLQAGDGERMVADLDRYHFSETLEILGPEAVDTIVVDDCGPAAPVDSVELDVVGWVDGTRELVVPEPAAALASAGLSPTTPGALDALRIRTGTPMPRRDFGEATLVHELGLERLAVSFTKGCYLGQETVARVEHRGKVNRRLRTLELYGDSREGSPVIHEGSEVGTLGTVARLDSDLWGALGLLRAGVPDQATVSVGDVGGRVVPSSGR